MALGWRLSPEVRGIDWAAISIGSGGRLIYVEPTSGRMAVLDAFDVRHFGVVKVSGCGYCGGETAISRSLNARRMTAQQRARLWRRLSLGLTTQSGYCGQRVDAFHRGGLRKRELMAATCGRCRQSGSSNATRRDSHFTVVGPESADGQHAPPRARPLTKMVLIFRRDVGPRGKSVLDYVDVQPTNETQASRINDICSGQPEWRKQAHASSLLSTWTKLRDPCASRRCQDQPGAGDT